MTGFLTNYLLDTCMQQRVSVEAKMADAAATTSIPQIFISSLIVGCLGGH